MHLCWPDLSEGWRSEVRPAPDQYPGSSVSRNDDSRISCRCGSRYFIGTRCNLDFNITETRLVAIFSYKKDKVVRRNEGNREKRVLISAQTRSS